MEICFSQQRWQVESKKAKLIETESKMVVIREWGVGGMGQMLFKDTNLQQIVNKP